MHESAADQYATVFILRWKHLEQSIKRLSVFQLSISLTHMPNMSFYHGVLPEQLKYTTVKFIHKKGNTADINNYRPIPLIPNISKIFEKLLYSRIISFIATHKILHENQNGYIHTRAIFQLFEQVLIGLNNKWTCPRPLIDCITRFYCANWR